MEPNCKIWIHKANFMMDGYIDDECRAFIFIPGHGGRSALPINGNIMFEGFTIYPG